jgi:hypothetical protein
MKKKTMTLDQLATNLKISRRSVARFRKAGLPADLDQARGWIKRRERARERDTLEMEKIQASGRWRDAQAALAEAEVKKQRGELIDLRAFQLEAGERLDTVKAAILEVPRRVSPGLVGRSASEIRKILEGAFSSACRPLDQPLASLAPL